MKKTENHLLDDFNEEDKVEGAMDFWMYKEEKTIIGIFSRWEADNYGEHAVLTVNNEDIHMPNLTALNGKLKAGQVSEGNKVKISYTGQTKAKSGRLYEDFDIFIKSSE